MTDARVHECPSCQCSAQGYRDNAAPPQPPKPKKKLNMPKIKLPSGKTLITIAAIAWGVLIIGFSGQGIVSCCETEAAEKEAQAEYEKQVLAPPLNVEEQKMWNDEYVRIRQSVCIIDDRCIDTPLKHADRLILDKRLADINVKKRLESK